MNQCKCGSYAINHHLHGRDGSEPELCDVCYWRNKYEIMKRRNVELISIAKSVACHSIAADVFGVKCAAFPWAEYEVLIAKINGDAE